MIQRDGSNASLWQNVESYEPQETTPKSKYDVVIVGGGITGISTALLLQKKGKKCIIIESHTLGFGTTSGTTAHLNTLLDTPYSQIIKNFNIDTARIVKNAAQDAINFIRTNIENYNIDCEFEDAAAFLFARDGKQHQELNDIFEAGKQVDLSCKLTDELPLDIPCLKVLKVEGQAKFHPVKYIFGLAKEFESAGGTILQNTKVLEVTNDQNNILKVTTDGQHFRCDDVIYATHIPPGVNLLHLRCIPWRSYAIAVQLRDMTYPPDLYYDMFDPYHYYRTQYINKEPYFIIGGEDHKTAQEKNTGKNFLELLSHAKSYFNVFNVSHQWSSQYYDSADGLPYIGNLPGAGDHVYVATGFGGNGLIYSSISAMILSKTIAGEISPYENVFHASRLKPIAGFQEFVSHNASVAGEFINKLVPLDKLGQLAELVPGEGRVVEYEGNKIALSKDAHGSVHAVSPVCTHLKCTVSWNITEQSWDCPCHGARYSADGKILNGPATRDLMMISLTEKSATKG
jgi:glycine/D-amino acid oxidase-like deaminating enzyme/nitrite reductase/ring-hydroxylating ferredoxin subunit